MARRIIRHYRHSIVLTQQSALLRWLPKPDGPLSNPFNLSPRRLGCLSAERRLAAAKRQNRTGCSRPKPDIQDGEGGQHMNWPFSPEFIPRTSNPGSCRKRSSAASSPVASCGNATCVCPVLSCSNHHTSAPHGPVSFVSTYTAAMSVILMRCSTCFGARQMISSSDVTSTMKSASWCFIPPSCPDLSSRAMSGLHPFSLFRDDFAKMAASAPLPSFQRPATNAP